jgi:hypothetical protein
MLRRLMTLLPVLLLLAATTQVYARGACGGGYCHSAPYSQPAYCQPQYSCSYVPKTVYVPQMVTEEREVTVCEYRPQQVQRTVYVRQMATEQREVTVTVMRPTVQERTITVQRCVPEQQQRTSQVTVMVPYQEQVQAVRRVCRMVPVEQTYTVTVDRGSYQNFVQKVPVRTCVPTQACGGGGCYSSSGCGGCYSGCGAGGCQYTTTLVDRYCQRWVPNLVQEERRCMVLKPTVEEVPYTYNVTKCRPEVREHNYTVTVMRTIPEQRTVQYTVAVPTQETRTINVPVCHVVPQQVETTVMVPTQVRKTVPVQVCRYVPKTIQCRVCTPVAVNCGGGCYSGGCGY